MAKTRSWFLKGGQYKDTDLTCTVAMTVWHKAVWELQNWRDLDLNPDSTTLELCDLGQEYLITQFCPL